MNAVSPEPLHRTLGLTDGELGRIQELLGRDPNDFELAVYSLLWSEHCGYKHSRLLLRRFPTSGERVLQGPGENAGVIDVGDGLAVALKVESHNHPSAVEPFQGAATGVGGILRDIFAMGARPIAILDSLRFGELDDDRQRHLFTGVVGGVGSYGNCVGVANVGGEVEFDDSYEHNTLVNAMCVGLLPAEKLTRAKATGPGNLVVLYGSKTGRDGIGGASVLASQGFDESSADKRPSVQIGDPFTGKKLIECTLDLLDRGLLASLQDLGAAGLASSLSEMAASGGVGIDVDLSAVPLREADMEPFEIMISESQERMAAVVEPARLDGRAGRLRSLGSGRDGDRVDHRLGPAAGVRRRRRGRVDAGRHAGRRRAPLRGRAGAARPAGGPAPAVRRAGRSVRRAARAARLDRLRQPAVGDPPVRPAGRLGHRGAAGRRRRRSCG